jgi:hypothetical protein
MVSSSMTWIFYTPALVLLAKNGYNLNKKDCTTLFRVIYYWQNAKFEKIDRCEGRFKT